MSEGILRINEVNRHKIIFVNCLNICQKEWSVPLKLKVNFNLCLLCYALFINTFYLLTDLCYETFVDKHNFLSVVPICCYTGCYPVKSNLIYIQLILVVEIHRFEVAREILKIVERAIILSRTVSQPLTSIRTSVLLSLFLSFSLSNH